MPRPPQTANVKTPTLLEVYEDFATGDYGELGGEKPPKGTYKGVNVVTTIDNAIVPRPGWKQLPVTGVPAGVVYGFWRVPGLALETGMALITGTVVTFDLDFDISNAATAMSGSLASTPTAPVDAFHDTFNSYLTSVNDKTYLAARSLSGGGGTLSAITGSPGGRSIERFGGRLFVGGVDANPARLYYTKFQDWTATGWDTATQYIDLPGSTKANIITMHSQRDRLLIGTLGGSWWVLSGVPDDEDTIGNAVLREVGMPFGGFGPRSPIGSVMTPDGRVYFMSLASDQPGIFNGVRPTILHERRIAGRLDYDGVDGTYPWFGGTILLGPEGVALGAGNEALGSANGAKWAMKIGGAWSHHETALDLEAWFSYDTSNRCIVVTDGGAVAGSAKFYTLPLYLDRAPIIDGNDQDTEEVADGAGSAPDASVTFPEWWADHGSEVLVRHVVVDFTKYDTGYGSNNSLDVKVTPLGSYELEGQAAVTRVALDEAPASATVAGVRQSKVVPVGDAARGRGFTVACVNLLGVKIHRVTVYGVVEAARLA